ncbi:uncharacterized protein LOC129581718 [Paramacrobiotus metropolitanus]|uniref:uncharacterized protein LOC129581718 n=1 Tax=Paramacrobiotus metropolitanus TaxID=2943436 RepID=UPI0024465C0E|nr:uncharacterized protein LOC129581718 [Paramacrobiotus metropolitanus]
MDRQQSNRRSNSDRMEPLSNSCDRCKHNTNNRKCTDCLFGQNIDNMNPDTVVTRLVSEVMHANLDAYTTLMESRYEPILQRKPWLLAQINDAVREFVNNRRDHWQQVPDPGAAPSQMAMRFNAPSQPNTQAYTMPPQPMLNYQQFPQQFLPAQNAQYPQADWAFNQPQYQQYRQPMPMQQATCSTSSTDPWLAERGYRPNVAQQFGSRTASQPQNVERQPSMSRNQPDARAGLMKKRRNSRQRNRDNVRSAEYQQQPSQSQQPKQNVRPAGDQQSNNQRSEQNKPAGNQQRDVHRRGYRDNRQLQIDPATVIKDVMHIVNNVEIYVHKLTGVLGIANREENPDVAQIRNMIHESVDLLERIGLRGRMLEIDYANVDLIRSLDVQKYATRRSNSLRTALDIGQLYVPITAVDIEILSQFRIFGDKNTETFLLQFILPETDPAKFYFFCRVASNLDRCTRNRNIDWMSIPYNTGLKTAVMCILAALLGSHSAHNYIYKQKDRPEYRQMRDKILLLGQPKSEQQEAQELRDILAAAGQTEMDTNQGGPNQFYDDMDERMKRFADRQNQYETGTSFNKRKHVPDSPDTPLGSKTEQPVYKMRVVNTPTTSKGNAAGNRSAQPQLGVAGCMNPPPKPTVPTGSKPVLIPRAVENKQAVAVSSAPASISSMTVKSTAAGVVTESATAGATADVDVDMLSDADPNADEKLDTE